MKRKTLAGLVVIALVVAAVISQRALGQAAAAQSAPQVPTFQVDPAWPKLPNNWVMGVVSSVAVDKHDNVWILHRPRVDVPEDKKNLVAPAVLEFDAAGKFIQAWGGPTDDYEWPDQEHGIYVDDKDNVWIGGSARVNGPTGINGKVNTRSDDMLLKLTTKGKLILQIGHRGQGVGSTDTKNVHASTDVFVYRKTNEAFVSDGYEGPGPQGNRRVIVFDADTGAFKRMWGGFGNPPVGPPPPKEVTPPTPGGAGGRGAGNAAGGDAPAGRGGQPALDTEGPGPQQLGTVHAVEVSNDDLVYVADRAARRVQVFTVAGKYVNQVFINRAGPSGASAAGIAFSPDPAQRFLYVADFGNSHIVVLDRKSLQVLYQFGERSAKPGDFQGIHNLAVDSKGNIYTAEVAPGNRAQKFVYKGLGPVPTQ